MAWRIEIDKGVQRSMKKLDRNVAKRIIAKLREISQLEDPRSTGKALAGNLAGCGVTVSGTIGSCAI